MHCLPGKTGTAPQLLLKESTYLGLMTNTTSPLPHFASNSAAQEVHWRDFWRGCDCRIAHDPLRTLRGGANAAGYW